MDSVNSSAQASVFGNTPSPMSWWESVWTAGWSGGKFARKPVSISVDALQRQLKGIRRIEMARQRIARWVAQITGQNRVTIPDLLQLLRIHDSGGTSPDARVVFIDIELDTSGAITQIGLAALVGPDLVLADGTIADIGAISEVLRSAVVVAHNGFEHDFPRLELAGVVLPELQIDSLRWSWLAWTTEVSHSLGALVTRFGNGGVDNAHLHDAVEDARALSLVWVALLEQLKGIPSAERAALAAALATIEDSGVLKLMLGKYVEVPKIADPQWSEDIGAPAAPNRLRSKTVRVAEFPGSVHVLRSLADARAMYPSAGLLLAPWTVLDRAKIEQLTPSWSKAVAIRALSIADGALPLVGPSARRQLIALGRDGATPIRTVGSELVTDLLTVSFLKVLRPLILETGLAPLFSPVSTGVVIEAPIDDEITAFTAVADLGAADRAKVSELLRRELSLGNEVTVGDAPVNGGLMPMEGNKWLWMVDALDLGMHPFGVDLVIDGPVGGERSRLMWERLFTADVTVQGEIKQPVKWSVLKGVVAPSVRNPGIRTAQLLGVAAALGEQGNRCVVADSGVQRDAVEQIAARVWREVLGMPLLRPPGWPTLEESERRLNSRTALTALTSAAAARDLLGSIDTVILARLPSPAASNATARRMVEQETEDPFSTVFEPLSAHLTAEFVAGGDGARLFVADPNLGSGLLADLIGAPISNHLVELPRNMRVEDLIIQSLVDSRTRIEASQRAVRAATKRLLPIRVDLPERVDLREFQKNVIGDLVSGKDVVAVYRTGLGKSLCYQIPALAFAAHDGVTLIVSPLIALQRDQLRGLRSKGVSEAVAFNSGILPEIRAGILRGIRAGFYRIIFVSPEGLAGHALRSAFTNSELALIAVDEAHCISEMGHDFRPDYRSLPRAFAGLLGLPDYTPLPASGHRPAVIALTGTASPQVRDDIKSMLNVNPIFRVDESFVRDEINFSVRKISGDERTWGTEPLRDRKPHRWATLIDVLEATERPTIIYTMSRKDAEALASELGSDGKLCLAYHAGMDDIDRQKIEKEFIERSCDIIVATNAFGMGIDKADVKSVIHWSAPSTLESLYQEAGRAARGPGVEAKAVLLFHELDLDRAYKTVRREVPVRWEIERVDRVLSELADHQGRSVIYVTDHDLVRLSQIRPELSVRSVLAHLERVGLVSVLDRLFSTIAVYRTHADTGELTTLEAAILEVVNEPYVPVLLSTQWFLGVAGVTRPKDVLSAIRGLVRRGILAYSRNVSVRVLEGNYLVQLETSRGMARRIWKLLKTHHDTHGTAKYYRRLAREGGDALAMREALEVLAEFGIIEVKYESADGSMPAVRLAAGADLASLKEAYKNAGTVLDALVNLDLTRLVPLAELAEKTGLAPVAVGNALVLLHLIGDGSVDLRSWEDTANQPQQGDTQYSGVVYEIQVLAVPDRPTLLNLAVEASMGRAREIQLRLEALRRYAEIEPADDGATGDVYQEYIERYLTEPDFLERVAADTTSSLLETLTPRQRVVVLAEVEKPIVVLAGPGTGKTTTLSTRIAYRVREARVLPERLLAVTFGKAATEEMRARLAQLNVRGVDVRTLDSLAFRILSDNWMSLGFSKMPEIASDSQRRSILRSLDRDANATRELRVIDKCKAEMEKLREQLHIDYQRELSLNDLVDFGDVKALAVQLLKEGGERSRMYLHAFEEILVDEFQDLGPLQIALVDAISTNAHLTIVGDPRQAIYEWNGADPNQLIQRFEQNITGEYAAFELLENFRSTKQILGVANQVIAHELPQLAPVESVDDRNGSKVKIVKSDNEAGMLDHLAKRVSKWLEEGIPDDQIAVLVRKGASVTQVAKALRAVGIAAHEAGLPHISTTQAYSVCLATSRAEVFEDPDDDNGMLDQMDRLSLLEQVLQALAGRHNDENEMKENQDDWERLRAAVDEKRRLGQDNLTATLEGIGRDANTREDRVGVIVTTMHKAKGLEWDAVAVPYVSAVDLMDGRSEPESCRVIYVALTRARKHLYLSWFGAKKTKWLD